MTTLYLALNAAFVFAAPWQTLAGKVEIGRIAAEALGGTAWADALTVVITLTDLPLASRRNYALTIGFVRKIANAARAAPAYTARLLALALSGKDRPMASRILAC